MPVFSFQASSRKYLAYHVFVGQVFGDHVLIVGDVHSGFFLGSPDTVKPGVLKGGSSQTVSSEHCHRLKVEISENLF